ncbi:MAG: hypothetical protein HC905_10375 [Bacteroidales bacterium]|nr:hypothetical protein [Bacteroidales bacterium]
MGKYSNYKLITEPEANDFNKRFKIINPVTIENSFHVDENSDGITDYTFDNPNFNFNQMRSNLVFRWEYRPGSQLYIVWSNERTDWLNPGYAPLRGAARRLADVVPNNIFMIKFNYWFSI